MILETNQRTLVLDPLTLDDDSSGRLDGWIAI